MTLPASLPPDGDPGWGNTGYMGPAHQRLTGNLAAGTPSARSLGTASSEAAPGNHTHAIPDANETTKGIAEVATTTETATGADDLRIVTPLKLAQELAKKANRLLTINTVTGTTYTLAVSDANDVLVRCTGASPTVTFPSDATAAIPVGATGTIRFAGTGQLTCAQGAGATLTSAGNAFKSAAVGALITWIKEAANTFAIDGYLTV